MNDPLSDGATMRLTIALAGDTMLGRGVAEALRRDPRHRICSPAVAEAARSADLFLLNLECCISARGQRWPDPAKPFFFRAPPSAADTLAELGVDGVALANNHALDYGPQALLDTVELLDRVGIAHAGAGADLRAAREPAVLESAGMRVSLVSLADHPAEYAATERRPGIAFAPLQAGVPAWVRAAISGSDADLQVASPHWGPNMVTAPVRHVRAAAAALADAGVPLVAGHSAHVFQGVEVLGSCTVLYDLGDFVDDYAINPLLRNDLGLLWFVTVEAGRVVDLRVLPLDLDYTVTAVAEGEARDWIVRRLRAAVHPRAVTEDDGLLRVELGPEDAAASPQPST